MNADSIFGSLAIGKDTSGNFRQSIYGLAVRSTANGRFIALHDKKLVDVTELTIDGTENLIYRIPKKRPIPKKDIIVRSDNPFAVMFVEEVLAGGTVKGIDPATGDVEEYHPVTNLLNMHFFVTVSGPASLLANTDSHELLPLLLLSSQAGGTTTADPLTMILLLQGLGSKKLDSTVLTTLALLRGGLAGGSNDPLALILALQGSDLFDQEKAPRGGGPPGGAPDEADVEKVVRPKT